MAIEGVKSAMSVQATANYQAPAPQVSVEAEGADIETMEVKTVSQQASINQDKENQENGANDKEPSDATIKQAIKDINRKMNSTVAEFGYHEGTHRITIKLKDKQTDKIVKEIPAEKTLDMIEKAWELAGILVDEKR